MNKYTQQEVADLILNARLKVDEFTWTAIYPEHIVAVREAELPGLSGRCSMINVLLSNKAEVSFVVEKTND